jgi:hypothetical protein
LRRFGGIGVAGREQGQRNEHQGCQEYGWSPVVKKDSGVHSFNDFEDNRGVWLHGVLRSHNDLPAINRIFVMSRNILPEACGNASSAMDTRLAKLNRALESAIKGMSTEQMRWHPPGKWSAGEVLEHLYLTYTGTIKGFERLLESGNPTTTPVSWKERYRSLLVLTFGYLPTGRKAPRVSEPQGLSTTKVLSELEAKIAAMDAILEQCETCFGRRNRLLDHPILGPLTATQWRKFHLLHGMHHRRQLVRLRKAAEKQ